VARWPGPILAASGALIIVAALPLAGLQIGWNEPGATPATAESNRGYAAADRHFPPNQLLPTVLTIAVDHDIRNPAGLIAIERITGQLMAIPGVRMVQSASRPAGTVPDEATLSGQAGVIGRQLNDAFDSVTDRLGRVADLDTALSSMATAVDRLASGLKGSADGLREIGSASEDIRAGMTGVQANATTVSGYLDPLRGFMLSTPDCPANPICSVVARVVQPVDDVVRSSAQISGGAVKLTDGSAAATNSLAALPSAVNAMADQLRQARAATGDLTQLAQSLGPQLRQLTDYLQEMEMQFRGSAAGGFYLPQRALTDPRLQTALDKLISKDCRATYLLIYGDAHEWSGDGAERSREIQTAVREATKRARSRRPQCISPASARPD
jgi:RND superfamily putative drug exporter